MATQKMVKTTDLFLSLGTYGSPGADNTASIAQALTDAGTAVTANGPRGHDGTQGPASRAVYVPAGVWTSTTQITIPRGVSLVIARGGVLRATAAIAGAFITTASTAWEGQSIAGGTIDCAEFADDGIIIRTGRYSVLRDVIIDDAKRYGVVLGDTGLSASSFEMKLHNVTVRRRTGLALIADSRGFYIAKCSDSDFDTCVAIGFETGFYNTGGDNRFRSCHAWGFLGNALPKYAFDDVNGAMSHYHNCVADSPTVAGFRFRLGYASAAQCSVFLASSQVDNTVIGFSMDAGAAHLNFSNNRVQGAGAIRMAWDYKGADDNWLLTSNVVSQVTELSVNKLPTKNTFAPYSTAGQLAEGRYFIPGAPSVGDMPVSVFWTAPAQVDSVLIRAFSGTGAQFQVWQGGTQLTPTFNAGDVAVLRSPFDSAVPVKLATNTGLYIKCIAAGTATNLTAVFKAYLNG